MPPNADRVIETLQTAAEENQVCSLRKHQVVHLPDEGELWVTGDLHDHRRNFDKLLRACDLGANPQRHIILHEIIHGDYYDGDSESSWNTLYRAADLKCDFPQQVHFLLANHDLAQIHGEGIMKAGLSVCEAFTAGVKKEFGSEGQWVDVAIKEFLLSLPLAVRAPNGIFCCHSLPTDAQIERFDFTVFDRQLTGPDYTRRTGPVYQLIWGRNMSPATAQAFANMVGADLVITGHQPQETGYHINGARHLILASDHNQGCLARIDLARRYDMPALVGRIARFAAMDV